MARVTQQLRRQLGIADAVVLGLGGMVGAGIFAGYAPAAAAAGLWLLPALILPAALALCSAVSTAAQATACPGIGAGYLSTLEYLGRWPARMAGSLHVVGKSAAAAAVAGVLGDYLYPARPTAVAIGALAVVTALNGVRITWPRVLNRVLLGITLAVLIVVAVTCFAVPPAPVVAATPPIGQPGSDDLRGFPAAAAIMFFAFTGFERLTGRGEDGGCFGRSGRRALLTIIGAAFVLYLVVGVALHYQLGSARLALSPAPLRDALSAADGSALRPLLLIAAPAALLPVLAWVHGSVRDVLRAMHGRGDFWLPGTVGSKSNPRFDLVAGVLGVLFLLVLSPAAALTLSVACVLPYYMFTNAAARVMLRDESPWPTRTACTGMVLSVVLVMTLPVGDLAAALLVAAGGAGLAAVFGRLARYRSRL